MLAAIADLDYRPNPLARGLSRGRCQTLGVVVPFFTHASAVERLRGVVAALDGSRYDLVLFNVESPVHRDEHFATLTRRDRADGLLIMSLPPPPTQPRAGSRRPGVPTVLLDTRGPGVPAVVTDDVEGGRARHPPPARARAPSASPSSATTPTTRSGSRRAPPASRATARRWPRPGWPSRPATSATARTCARWPASWPIACCPRRDRPTAVFAASDTQALGVLEAARTAGLDVPGDLSVVGFDDVEVSGYAGLTTVRQPLFESGRLAAELLLESLDAEDAARRVGAPPRPRARGAVDDRTAPAPDPAG